MAFFHASLKCKRKNKIIDHMLLKDGRVLNTADDVHNGTMTFFLELLSTSVVSGDEEAISLLTPSISNEDNFLL